MCIHVHVGIYSYGFDLREKCSFDSRGSDIYTCIVGVYIHALVCVSLVYKVRENVDELK